jgi:hypothetical protein
MHAFMVIDESVLGVTACAGLCMMTRDGMVAGDGDFILRKKMLGLYTYSGMLP